MNLKYIKTKTNNDNILFLYKIIDIINPNYIKQSLIRKCFSSYFKQFETNLNFKNIIILLD